VFSPFHDVGFGGQDVAKRDLVGLDECKAVFGIINGNDPGTIFELGYAVAKNKPVSVYAERSQPSDLTMLEGTGCKVFSDYTTAMYNAIWDCCE
jgi:nucleoside 2-deoxyribosyltransferase